MGDAFDDIINATNKYGTWEAISRDHMICALEAAEDQVERLKRERDEALAALGRVCAYINGERE